MPWVKTVPPEDATSALANAYARNAKTAGRVSEIRQVQTSRPTYLPLG